MYEPINKSEREIKDQLVKNGLEPHRIEFRGDAYNRRYIRYSYWQQLTESQLQGTDLEEDLYEDDDGDIRGRPIIRRLYSYIIK
jgi:hypothetical protein